MAGRADPSLPVRAPSGTSCSAHQSKHTLAAMLLFTLCNDVFSCPPAIIRPLTCEEMLDARGAPSRRVVTVASGPAALLKLHDSPGTDKYSPCLAYRRTRTLSSSMELFLLCELTPFSVQLPHYSDLSVCKRQPANAFKVTCI